MTQFPVSLGVRSRKGDLLLFSWSEYVIEIRRHAGPHRLQSPMGYRQRRPRLPGGGGELRLYQRGDEFSIKIAGRSELMNSRVHGSEDALAELACRLSG